MSTKNLILHKAIVMTPNLTIQSKKIELIQWLSAIDDMDILNKVSALLLDEQKKEWQGNISEAEYESIEKGLQDAADGKLVPHSKARAIYGKWL